MSETSNVPELSPEKLREYTATRAAYHIKRDGIKTQIRGYHAQILALRETIGELEKQIEKEKPRVDGATKLCEHCDMYSMLFEGIQPGQGGRQRWYECVVCRHTAFET